MVKWTRTSLAGVESQVSRVLPFDLCPALGEGPVE